MKFGPLLKAYFDAEDGAYSIVTINERDKGQITLTETDGEAEIVVNHFGEENIPREASGGKRLTVNVYDRAAGDAKESDLTINFPKSKGNELRIYRGAIAGFAYEAGDVWFVFVSKGQLYVGSMPELGWRTIGIEDTDDDNYQRAIEQKTLELIESPVSTSTLSWVHRYRRDPSIARKALELADFRCEYNPATTLFISRYSQNRYVEAHHLIPLAVSHQFTHSLDVKENIVALAPHWHRAIHHAEIASAMPILEVLIDKRAEYLHSVGVSREDLIEIYGCAEISK